MVFMKVVSGEYVNLEKVTRIFVDRGAIRAMLADGYSVTLRQGTAAQDTPTDADIQQVLMRLGIGYQESSSHHDR